MIKLAYIILFHKSPEQLSRLINKLDDGNNIIIIHVCKNTSNSIYSELKKTYKNSNNIFFCKRENGAWGEFGIVKAVLNSIKFLKENNINYQYINVISGQDYPIKSNKYINEFFKENNGKQYLKFWKILPDINGSYDQFNPWENEGLRRIEKRRIKIFKKYFYIPDNHYMPHGFFQNLKIFIYETPIKIKNKTFLYDLINLKLSTIFHKHRKFKKDLEPYGGSQWWSITKDCAEFVLDFYNKNTSLVCFYNLTLLSDEQFLSTCLMNSNFKDKVVNDNLRHIDFPKFSPHPKTFTESDFEELKNSKMIFARKLDLSINSKIFDLIDENII